MFLTLKSGHSWGFSMDDLPLHLGTRWERGRSRETEESGIISAGLGIGSESCQLSCSMCYWRPS